MRNRKRRMLLASALLGFATTAAAASPVTRHEIDADTGLESWRVEAEGFSLELVQRLPDQTRAFFQGRGLDAVLADEIARGCVFQTIAGNTAAAPDAPVIALDLAEWRIDSGQGQRPLMLEHDWQREWERRGADPAARIAFRWALYPTRQEFHPGDYNWGMTTYGVLPGSVFDLHIVWRRGDELRQYVLKGLRCAQDIDGN